MPFQRLIEELQPARRIGQMPLFQSSFTFFSDFEQLPQVPGLSVTPVKTSSGVAMYDLDEHGKIVSWREYFDISDLARQLGLKAEDLLVV